MDGIIETLDEFLARTEEEIQALDAKIDQAKIEAIRQWQKDMLSTCGFEEVNLNAP